MPRSRSSERRWDVEIRVEVGHHDDDEDETIFHDAARMRYPSDWTDRQCAADFLRAMADEIESGEMQEGTL